MKTTVELGRLLTTPGAMDAAGSVDVIAAMLRRHVRGDWGDVDGSDRRENDRAAREGGERILSVYSVDGTTFWIITEADRSATTVLLPSEY